MKMMQGWIFLGRRRSKGRSGTVAVAVAVAVVVARREAGRGTYEAANAYLGALEGLK